jgi:hypothetical protein
VWSRQQANCMREVMGSAGHALSVISGLLREAQFPLHCVQVTHTPE